MGLTRKVISASTLGAVDFRSDKERIARSTRQGAKATKKQNKLIAEQNDLLAQQAVPAPYVQQPQYVAPAPCPPPPSAPGLMQRLVAQAMPQPTTAPPAASPVPPPPAVPAGWYPDPNGAPLQRYWDGAAWTEHTAPQAPGQ